MRVFNQIRKVLIRQAKLKEYIKYAIGEIILVVIGILIALQINNWNEERKSNKEKFLTLEILKQSFEKNKEEIESTLEEYDHTLKITNLRIKNTGPQIENISQSTIDSIRIIDIVTLELANNLNSHILKIIPPTKSKQQHNKCRGSPNHKSQIQKTTQNTM